MSKGIGYWSGHLAAIATEDIQTAAYAKRESLSVSALYYWRKRIKAQTHGPALPNAASDPDVKLFMPVRVTHTMGDAVPCSLMVAPGVRLELAQLPSPEWLVALGAAMSGQVR